MPDAPPADPVEVFRALCWSKAYRWRNGIIDWEDPADDEVGGAIDPLQQWAVDHGLIERIGQDAVQAIISDAFAENHNG